MSVETTTKMYVNVPVKLLAAEVLRAIKNDHDVMELELEQSQRTRATLRCNGEWVFTEPGE